MRYVLGKQGMRGNLTLQAAIFTVLLLTTSLVNAVTVEVNITELGAGSFRAHYTLLNNSPSALQLIDILFDPALYDENSLNIVSDSSVSAGWDETILASSLQVPAAYDIFALAGGVPAGQTEGGFAIEFSWLGAATPSLQPFEIYDADTFDLLATGTTQFSSAVPLPAAFWLYLGGLATLRAITKAKRA